jgi:hypothetical protein
VLQKVGPRISANRNLGTRRSDAKMPENQPKANVSRNIATLTTPWFSFTHALAAFAELKRDVGITVRGCDA